VVSHATNTGLLNAISTNPTNARRLANRFSNATLLNNIIWHNRSFCWAITGPTPPNNFDLFDSDAAGTGCNVGSLAGSNPVYRDLAVIGVAGGALTSSSDIVSGEPDPLFVSSYFNGSAKPAPIIPGTTTLIDTAATADEGGNFIEVRYGPLTPWNCPQGANGQPTDPLQKNCPLYGDYHIRTGSPAIDAGASRTNGNGVPTVDYDNDNRPALAIDIGADEFGGGSGGGGAPAFPQLNVLDDFNRDNANNLGGNWQQLVVGGSAGIRVNGNQAFCINTGLSAALCALGANAYRPTGSNSLGPRQAAAFTFTSATLNNTSLWLKAGANYVAGAYLQGIRVRYNNGQVFVETTANGGLTFQQHGSVAASFANGNQLTALVDATGQVFLWKSVGNTNTLLGAAIQLPTTGDRAFTTGSGRIGLYLPPGARVDNFAGGTVQ
jgi:hypothetical protein